MLLSYCSRCFFIEIEGILSALKTSQVCVVYTMCTSWCSIWVTIIPQIHKNMWWKIRKSLKITTNLKRNGKLFCTASISCKGFYKNENSLLAIFWDQQMQWSPLKNRHTTPSKFQSINKNTRHRLDTLVHSHIKKFLIETLRWDKKAFYVKAFKGFEGL